MVLLCSTWYGCRLWVQSKKPSLSTGSPSRKTQSKKVESKKPFFDYCVRKPYHGLCRKQPFSTDKSDCIRNIETFGLEMILLFVDLEFQRDDSGSRTWYQVFDKIGKRQP